jgi:uracil-DNA glycosylase
MCNKLGTFPFGQPVKAVCQSVTAAKQVFVLGVYASAVHARWIGPDKKTIVSALAVDSEPAIFWRGENAKEIIEKIPVPVGAGSLVPAAQHLNGPSGRALDDQFLTPLGLTRSDVWLCDLVPYSCKNAGQKSALARTYDKKKDEWNLPDYDWEGVPDTLANESRCQAISQELKEASPSVIITLGDQPLKWFTRRYKSEARLLDYGTSADNYGRLHDINIEGRAMKLLPLVHPRQAARLGSHSQEWSKCHEFWMKAIAPIILKGVLI